MTVPADTPKDSPAGGQPPQNLAGAHPDAAPPAASAVASGTANAALPLASVKYLSDALEQAELLLGYAAEAGIEVEDKVRDGVLKARLAREGGTFPEPTAANLLNALTVLAAKVRPMTVESLRHPGEDCEPMRSYGVMGILFICVIVFFSLITFVSDRISEKIKTDVDTANGLASKLSAELGPPPGTNRPPTHARAGTNAPPSAAANPAPDEIRFGSNGPPRGLAERDIISDLQQFASAMRAIEGYARKLDVFVFDSVPDPFASTRANRQAMRQKLELTPGLGVMLSREFAEKVEVYQDVRDFGISVREMVAVYYGAIAACLLPVLYALLGAEAYLLRLYESQIKNRTFTGREPHLARYLIAGIGGLVVGLFNIGQSITISPFAIAFLVGYAVDVFYSFLEGSLQTFRRSSPGAGAQGLLPKA
jgi:hypothetical protein